MRTVCVYKSGLKYLYLSLYFKYSIYNFHEVGMKSNFYNEVYECLLEIPEGKVTTYGRIAEMLGNKCYAGAVGNALHVNPDVDKYPCYKVVNSKGRLSANYAFGGIEEQKKHLQADGIEVIDFHVDLKKYGY